VILSAVATVLITVSEVGAGGSFGDVVASLGWVMAVLVALAIGVGVRVSRIATAPLEELADSARRIGQGDLATPVETGLKGEAGALASSMEDMRRRLGRLTAELRRSEAEAQALLGGIVEGVYAVDEERRIRYLNPQAAALLGVDANEALGRFCGDVLSPEPVDGIRPCESRCPIVHARSRGSTRASEVVRLPGGRRRNVIITSSVPTGGRQVQILRDETEIEGARRVRDAIVATVSHEFRTPLSAQLASLELLRESLEGTKDGDGAPSDSAELVRALERSSLRLVQLVDNLLESVRLESGEGSISRRSVPLDEVLEDAVELTAPLFQQRGQQVDLEVPHPVPRVSGDAQRLTQVVVNLLANANKYAPEGSGVRVRAGAEDGAVWFSIEDEGPGLPEGAEHSIFERFRRVGEAQAGGMGLGLWIVKSIVERHGGSVRAMSLPGGGSRFTVQLRASDAPGAPS
jgi:signal transduction histidine kinase/HAMP domain-containing protein